MADIRAGLINPLYLFDVAEGIDLGALRDLLGARATVARLDDKTPGPPRVQYATAPLVIDGEAFGFGEFDGFRVRVKFFDYGVVGLMLSRPFAGSWAELLDLGQSLIESEPLERRAGEGCRQIVERVGRAMRKVRAAYLSEDYLIFAVTQLERPMLADELLERHGGDIAQLVRGERQALSRQERDEVLRNRISYLANDLVVAAWNAAFVYDTESAVLATAEILELVNSQLLEFRYHDDLLESELTRIYAALQQPRWSSRVTGRRHTKQAVRLHTLFIDVNELTDRMENAVKLVGDIYAARLFGIVSARLGLDHWKRNVQNKLKTLDDIYRFAVDQTGVSRGNFLELVIVLILLLELGLFFAGIME
jgi:hypothetical protein